MKIKLGEETIEFNEESLKFKCCFCEEDPVPSPSDPYTLNVIINIDKEADKIRNQFFWCHLECINNQLAAPMSLWSRIKIITGRLFSTEKRYLCCLCKTTIKTSSVDPSAINIMPNNEEQESEAHEQFFSCHLGCFKKALLPDIPLYLEDLGNEDEKQ